MDDEVKSTGRREKTLDVLVVSGIVIVATIVFLANGRTTVFENPAAVPSAPAAPPAERNAAPVEESRRLARGMVSGKNMLALSVAVAVDGEVVWAEGFGWSDYFNRTPLTAQTRFRLGALSKPMTAVVAAQLSEQGRLDLDRPVQDYVPAYPEKQWTVTTRQLMGDLAGVHRPRGDNRNDSMPTSHCDDLDEAVAELNSDPLFFQPGTEHRYSIWGWVLVSAAIEGAAGESFERVMTARLFGPLGMTRTAIDETRGVDDVVSLFNPQDWVTNGLGIRDTSNPDYSCLAGAGAILSTPTDLVRFGSATMTPGFLEAETVTAMQTPGRLASGATTTYGLGWTIGDAQLAGKPARMISHRGSPRGGYVSLLTFPDHGLAVAAAGAPGDGDVNALALQIADLFARPPRNRFTASGK
jgi:serine beta-lactamase-like protein LACTB